MPYCSLCGQSVQESAKFCCSCGTRSVTPDTTPAPPTRVVVIEPKKGGRLAVKALLISLVLAIIFTAATHQDKGAQAVGMVVAFGIGGAYGISNLRKWKRSNGVVHGAAIGWTMSILLLLISIVSLANVGGGDRSNSAVPAGGPVSSVDPKDLLLRSVQLDYTCGKGGFDNVMIANFSIKNPTQYRFKDVQVKCTHFAPSGTAIDSNTRTIYQLVEAKSTKVIPDMNMGFIHSQASTSRCVITDLTVVPGEGSKI